MKKYVLGILIVLSAACTKAQEPVNFEEKALADTFISLTDKNLTFGSILEKHKGETILIDIWASWCRDCIKGMPKVKQLQAEFSDVTFLFLSLDKSEGSWKKGIEKYELKGAHYFIPSGWKGDFCSSIDLDWIPRYMIVDSSGTIKLFKAIKANDARIKEALSK